MAAIDLGGLPYSQIGQLQIRSRSGTIPSTIPRIGGWAVDPVAECAFVEDAGLAVPSTAVSIGALKYTPDGALYVTADTTTGPFTNIGGLKVRQDGAACIITKTPSVTLDPYIGGAAYDGATQAMVVGGAGFGFILLLSDAGAGAVRTTPLAGVGAPTFTRATTATTVNSAGLIISVGTGVARSAYDPTSLTYLGYLAEGARTNLCLQSQDLGTSWVNTRTTNTLNSAVAPDGTTTADTLVEDATAASSHITATPNWTGTLAPYTFYVFAKASTRTKFALSVSSSHVAGGAQGNFDLGAGTAGAVTNCTNAIKAYPNGWYLCSITYTPTAAVTAANFLNLADAAGSFSYNGDGTSGMFFWGAQIELGSFPSSYIPTTTVAVTRNADVLAYSYTGNADTVQGTAYSELTSEWTAANPAANDVAISIGSAAAGWLFGNTPDVSTTVSTFDGTTTLKKTGLSDLSTGVRKRIASWGATGQSITGDGLSVSVGAFDGVYGNNTQIGIGHGAGGNQWFGTIKNIMISQSQLTDAQLSALTA